MKRVEWVDTTKAIGMFLVFYGHFIQRIYDFDQANEIVAVQFKFIYSFHMPLFFIISGFFAKQKPNKSTQLKRLVLQRIIPVFSFSLLVIPLWLLKYKILFGHFNLERILEQSLKYLGGDPRLNFITWFLICLFTAEVISLLLGLLSKSQIVNLITGLLLVTVGYYIIENYPLIEPYSRLYLNFWYIHEGIIALGFYLIGNWLFPVLRKNETEKKWIFYLMIPITLLLMITSSAFLGTNRIVVMSASLHGDFFPFIIESILGTLLVLSLAIVIPSNKVMNFIGSNTLILLGLNGIFHHFINMRIARLMIDYDSWWSITAGCTLVSILSLAVCFPMVLLIKKYLPQLFGNPDANGPLLKPLI